MKDVQEPKKKRNAARELNGKGKKCRVSYSGGSCIFLHTFSVVKLMTMSNSMYMCF